VPPARIMDLASEGYEASLWMWRYTSLVVYRTVTSGWVGDSIVEELCKGLSGGLRAFGLIIGDCAQGDQHCAINGTGIE
jgi:hypothetical protein